METFIAEKDILISIKYRKDISQEEKKKYDQLIKGLFMKELCPIHNEKLNDDGLCNLCLEQSNK